MVPPQVSPTANASSSEYPYVTMPRSFSPERMARATCTTAPSTHPPETEPATSPASFTAIVAPGSRGLDPSIPTTRAIATRWPAVRHRSMSSRTSFIRACSLSGSLRDHSRELFQRGERMTLDELVNVRQCRRHSARERRVARAGLQRIDPHDAERDAIQARHLLGENLGITPVPAVGEDHDDRAPGQTANAPLVVEAAHTLPH